MELTMGLFSTADNRSNKSRVTSEDAAARTVNDAEEFQRIVLHAFGLQPILREVFLLCHVQGCSIAEAASILNIGPAAAAARLDRARRLLGCKSRDSA
jgi:DNA-directed RNA polymerase specialized sigma24 family protein